MCSNRPCGLAGIPTLSGPQSSICTMRGWPINSEVHPAQCYDSKTFLLWLCPDLPLLSAALSPVYIRRNLEWCFGMFYL